MGWEGSLAPSSLNKITSWIPSKVDVTKIKPLMGLSVSARS